MTALFNFEISPIQNHSFSFSDQDIDFDLLTNTDNRLFIGAEREVPGSIEPTSEFLDVFQ